MNELEYRLLIALINTTAKRVLREECVEGVETMADARMYVIKGILDRLKNG